MQLKRAARRLAFGMLGSGPAVAVRLARIRKAGVVTVLNLHRVSAEGASAYEALSPALFERLVRWLKTRYRLTSFAELAHGSDGRRPPLVLSFDDGYRDFVDVVAPILRRHGVGANQNIVPACIESGLPPPTVLIQDFIGAAPARLLREVALPGIEGRVDPERRAQAAFQVSATLQKMPIVRQKQVIAGLQASFDRFDGFRPTPIMRMDELAALAGEFEIGAHSFEHATMSCETGAYFDDDLQACTAWFTRRLGRQPTIYAFPNGMADPVHCETARRAGYRTVLLVGERFTGAGQWCHGRFTFHARTMPEARFRATGAFTLPR